MKEEAEPSFPFSTPFRACEQKREREVCPMKGGGAELFFWP